MKGFQPYNSSDSLPSADGFWAQRDHIEGLIRAKSQGVLQSLSMESLRGGNSCNPLPSESPERTPNWQWSDIEEEIVLVTQEKGEGSPAIATAISTDYEIKTSRAKPKLSLHLDKPFKFNKNLGFNWHKSWNIPKITVKLDGLVPVEKLNEKVFFQLFAVKQLPQEPFTLSEDEARKPKLVNVGLKGKKCMEMSEDETVLSGIGFTSTSYIHGGTKFQLLFIASYGKVELGSKENKILFCKMSPDIYVDSRKSAREAESIKNKKLSTFFQDFDPSLYSKMKKQLPISSSSKNSLLTSLPPNIESNGKDYPAVIEYLTAQNIRNKVRNPIFLAIRFPDCFTIHYNPVAEKLKDKKVEEVLSSFQCALNACFEKAKKRKEACFDASPGSSLSNVFGSSEALSLPFSSSAMAPEAIFCLLISLPKEIDESNVNRKLVDLVVKITSTGQIGAAFRKEAVPPEWECLPGDELLLEIYKKCSEATHAFSNEEERNSEEAQDILIKKRSFDDLRLDDSSAIRPVVCSRSPSLNGEPFGAAMFNQEKKKKHGDFLNQFSNSSDFLLNKKPNVAPGFSSFPQPHLPLLNRGQTPNPLFPSMADLQRGQFALLASNNFKFGQKLLMNFDALNSTLKKLMALQGSLFETSPTLSKDERKRTVHQLGISGQQQLMEGTQAVYSLIQSMKLMQSMLLNNQEPINTAK